MSGLYLLLVLGIWCGLTWLLLKTVLNVLASGSSSRGLRIVLVAAVALAWFGATFWYGGGRKVYYDAEVNRLCAIDGGVKVYETVKLAPVKFDKYGQINFYKPTQGDNALGSDYIFKRETKYLLRGNPDMFRMHTQIVRRFDGKLLGESVFYKRGGGDMPGPWHGSSFMCPELSVANDVLRQVFSME